MTSMTENPAEAPQGLPEPAEQAQASEGSAPVHASVAREQGRDRASGTAPRHRAPVGLRRRLRWALGVAEGAVGLVLLVVLSLTTFVPGLMGWVPLTVLTGSMSPRIPAGSLVVMRNLSQEEADNLPVGAVVTYVPDAGSTELVTHRVVAVTAVQDGTARYTVKGDANAEADPGLVEGQQVLGIMRYHVPYLGYMLKIVSPEVKSVARVVLASALMVYALYEASRSGIDWYRERGARDRAPARRSRTRAAGAEPRR